MAGLFSLGGGGRGSSSGNQNQNPEQQQQNRNNQSSDIIPHPETLFWYNKNDDVSSYRGFELWNQHQIANHHARPLLHRDLYSSAAALGVGPSSFSDDQSSSPRSAAAFMAMRSAAMAEVGGGSSGGGGISCQDCGNQAKKDCPHIRCRTCCKSRGFQCQTHVKSTWVPAAKRRERHHQQQQLAALQEREVSKRPNKDHNIENPSVPTSSALASTRLPSSSEQGNFPSVVSYPAEFRCVRVSSMEDTNDQYAYQTAVNIGGHLFKGILYDYGPDTHIATTTQPLDLITATAAAATTAAAAVVSSTGTLIDPSSLYNPAPLNTFMAASGTQFFPHPRS